MMLWTAAGLALAGLAAIIIEMFVPAAGILGLGGVASLAGSVVVIFQSYGTLAGSIYMILVIIAGVSAFILYFKHFPNSFIGKRFILWEINPAQSHQEDNPASDDMNGVAHLTGALGITLTNLRPSGMARINDKKWSVVTVGDYIPAGSEITVIRHEGNRIVVRKVN